MSFDVAVTGTATGGTPEQLATLCELLWRPSIRTLRHGDCVGVDAQAHELMVVRPGGRSQIIIHPPRNPQRRAFCDDYDLAKPLKEYLERDQDLAMACDMLLAVPSHDKEQLRSGTWATARYAYKAGKLVLIIHCDGNIEPFRPKSDFPRE